MTNQRVDLSRAGELLHAAQLLLKQRADLDSVQVLHLEAARALGDAPLGATAVRYVSVAEARRQQQRLQSEWRRSSALPSAGPWLQLLPPRLQQPLQQLLQRWLYRPEWAARAALPAVAVLLTLRYAWGVTYGKNWERQNPEGNWISRYYTSANFEGYPMLRYDVGVNADYGARGPVDSIRGDHFSVRWDTCILVSRDVVVPIQLRSDDSSKLLLDGVPQIVIDPGPDTRSADVALHPGLRHLRVEFVELTGMALVRLDGLELAGTDVYRFRRPVRDGTELRCQEE